MSKPNPIHGLEEQKHRQCSCCDTGDAAFAGQGNLSKPNPIDGGEEEKQQHQCRYCGTIDADTVFQRCSACKSVRYCSHECQALDWARRHRTECPVIQRRRVGEPVGLERCIVINSERSIVARCANPNYNAGCGGVLQQFMPKEGAYPQTTTCWCPGVGNESEERFPRPLLRFVSIDAKRIDELKECSECGPLAELKYRRDDLIESEAIGCDRIPSDWDEEYKGPEIRLQITKFADGGDDDDITVTYAEKANKKKKADAYKGANLRITMFVVGSGGDTPNDSAPTVLSNPCSSSRVKCNTTAHIWCDIGETPCAVVCDRSSLPRFPKKRVLQAMGQESPSEEGNDASEDVITFVLFIEYLGKTTTKEKFEDETILNMAHSYHEGAGGETPFSSMVTEKSDGVGYLLNEHGCQSVKFLGEE